MKYICDKCGEVHDLDITMKEIIKGLIRKLDDGWMERMLELKSRVQFLEIMLGVDKEQKKNVRF